MEALIGTSGAMVDRVGAHYATDKVFCVELLNLEYTALQPPTVAKYLDFVNAPKASADSNGNGNKKPAARETVAADDKKPTAHKLVDTSNNCSRC